MFLVETALSNIFTLAKILRVPDIHQYAIGMFIYKFKMGKLLNIFNNFFQENREIHQYPTRNSRNLRPPKIKTKLAQRFIKKTGVEFWNTISTRIPNNNSIGTFKKAS